MIGVLNAEPGTGKTELCDLNFGLRTPNSELFYEPNAERRTPNAERFSPIQVLSPDLILVDWGPMTLTLSVWADSQPRPIMAVQSAIKALELLGQLAEYQNLLKIPSNKLKRDDQFPPLVKRAFSACRKVSSELTPMAAVAGLVADEIVASALALGAERVIVNNGGDIALRDEGKTKNSGWFKRPL